MRDIIGAKMHLHQITFKEIQSDHLDASNKKN